MSPLSPESRRKLNPRQGKTLSTSNICQVCGDSASIYNYGALSCQSCKTFFRRNASHPYDVRPCFFNKTCEVDVRTRRICTACRLEKCLSVGMSPDLIRKALSRHDKSSSTNTPGKEMLSSLPLTTLDLLQADRSTLISSEWTLLSNIIHAHDRFSAIPMVRDEVDRVRMGVNSIVFDTNKVLETVLLMYTSTKSFVTSTPDFRILTVNEQTSLLDRNFHGIMSLISIIFMRATGIFDTPSCLNVFNGVYGTRMIVHAQRIRRELDLDLTILKVLLLILSFSSNCFAFDLQTATEKDNFLHGTFRLFGSQNVYVELLWKFMIYRYGYQQTVIRFTKILLLFLDIMKHCGEIYTTNDVHHHLVEGAVGQMKHSLIMDKNDSELLWGKT